MAGRACAAHRSPATPLTVPMHACQLTRPRTASPDREKQQQWQPPVARVAGVRGPAIGPRARPQSLARTLPIRTLPASACDSKSLRSGSRHCATALAAPNGREVWPVVKDTARAHRDVRGLGRYFGPAPFRFVSPVDPAAAETKPSSPPERLRFPAFCVCLPSLRREMVSALRCGALSKGLLQEGPGLGL